MLDPKEIRELIEMISRSNFSNFELEESDGFKLKLVKEPAAPGLAGVSATPSPAPVAPTVVPTVPAAPPAATAGEAAPSTGAEQGLVDFDSPIVGTFYRSSNPDSPAFTDVGQTVEKGQVLCIVEAMKVMNEIESEFAAEVAEVCVTDGQPVEFGEVLFRLRPLG